MIWWWQFWRRWCDSSSNILKQRAEALDYNFDSSLNDYISIDEDLTTPETLTAEDIIESTKQNESDDESTDIVP